jgi:tetratricopeptide (TPR) repeat protein
MRRQLNTRLLFWVVGSFAVAATAVHFLHAYQVRQNVGAYLQQAELALAKGDKAKAIKYWRGYFAMVDRADLQVLIHFTNTLDELARSPRERFEVWHKINEILGRDRADDALSADTRVHLRFRLIQQELHLGMFREAIKNIRILMPDWKMEPGYLEHLLGWSYEAAAAGNLEDYKNAVDAFGEAIRKNPAKVESYVLRAEVLGKNLANPEEAEQTMNDLVSANSKKYEAYLARSRYYRQQQKLDKAGNDIAAAQALDLSGRARAEVHLAAAELAMIQGDVKTAKAEVEQGLKADANYPPLYRAMAGLEVRLGQPQAAADILRDGVKRFPNATDLAVSLADLLIDDGKIDEAERMILQLRRSGMPATLPDYLRARVLMKRDRWLEATTVLERVRNELAVGSDWACQVNALLGLCFERLGDINQQLASFERAVALDGSWTAARLGLAYTLVAVGRFDEALQQYAAVQDAMDAPPELWLLRGRALLLREVRKPEGKRDWSDVKQALDLADKSLPGSAPVAVLRADLLAAEKNYLAARAVLTRTRSAHPKDVEPWCALVDLAVREGKHAEGLELLAEAENALGPRVELRLARARLWAAAAGPDMRRGLTPLAENLQGFRPEEQVRVLRDLAVLWQTLGDNALDPKQRQADRSVAEALWKRIVDLQPRDLGANFALLELSLLNGRVPQATALTKQLRTLEGESGTLWRYGQAAILVAQARKPDKTVDSAMLERARKQIGSLQRQRPDWPALPMLEARIAELERNSDEAIRAYQRALTLGERRPRVLRHYITLVFERREFEKTDAALNRIEEYGPLSKELSRIGAEAALALRNPNKARRLAEKAASPDTTDVRDLLWLARIYKGIDELALAEATLRRAVKTGGRSPESWLALVEFLVQQGAFTQAEEARDQARATLPPERAALALARCEEMLGNLDRAEALFREAVTGQPTDFVTLSQAADFFRRNDRPDQADPLLRKLLEPVVAAPGNFVARARRQLAVDRAFARSYDDAMGILEANRAAGANAIADERARALVMASQPKLRADAVMRVQKTLPVAPRSAEEQFWLVKVYDLAGDDDSARRERNTLFTSYDVQPYYLAYFVRHLLQREDLPEAQACLDRLKRLEPRHPRTGELERLLEKARAEQNKS